MCIYKYSSFKKHILRKKNQKRKKKSREMRRTAVSRSSRLSVRTAQKHENQAAGAADT